MNPQTTDAVMGDTNSLVPRVLETGSITSFTRSVVTSRYKFTGSATTGVLAASNPIVECFLYTTGGGVSELIKMNYVIDDPTAAGFSIAAHYYIDGITSGSNRFARINVEVVKSTDVTPTGIYYVVYSSSFATGSVV